ncbi:MAG: hypothetical protein KAI47_26690, partial [Deltaproteobacteria bacterium]|nr:hypothetical protein [Deltaproteobacteria bacterium]
DPIGYTVIQMPAMRERESEHLEALRIELDRARQQASQAGARTDEWATKVELISSQLVARGDQLEAATVRVQQLESELALTRSADVDPDVDLVVEHKELKDERDELRRRVEEFEQFRAEIASHDEASDDVEELRRRLAEAERRVLEASTRGRSEVTQVRRELRDKTEEATQAGEELKAVRVALDEARSLLADRTRGTDGEVLAGLRDELEATREELQLTVDASRARISEFEAEVRRIEEEYDGSDVSGAEVAPLRRLVDNLTQQLEAERARVDEARAALAEERGMRLASERRVEDEHIALTEARQRAESADRRADALISRVEEGASERVKFHERIAELQALRQSDRWRRDEILGRLRECQGRLSPQGGSEKIVEGEKIAEWEKIEERKESGTAGEREADEREWRSEPTQHERVGGGDGGERPSDRGDDPTHDVLRADLGRADARIAVLQQRCDELMADAQASAEATSQAQQALKRVDTATDTPVESSSSASSSRAVAPKRVRSASPSGERDASLRLRTLELELGRARDVATELQATQSELRDARKLADELATAQSDLRRRLRETSSPSSASDHDPEVVKDDANDVPRAEVVARYAKQVAELRKGAALHLGEVERLGCRIEELEAFAEELRQERDALEVKLTDCEGKVGVEGERAEGYRREFAAQGKKLAKVEGELLRLRGAEAGAS